MTFVETFTLSAYFFVLIILAIYGWHRYYLVYLRWFRQLSWGPPLDPCAVI